MYTAKNIYKLKQDRTVMELGESSQFHYLIEHIPVDQIIYTYYLEHYPSVL